MSTFLPKFLTKNKIISVDYLSDSASTTPLNRTKLIDRNREYLYMSVGATSGTRTITWTPNTATTINRIFVQGINWDAFTIKYNTSSFFSTPISFTGNTKTNMYFEFDSVSVTNVVISVFSTFPLNEVIKCGQFYAGSELYQMVNTTGGQFVITPVQKATVLTLSDGTTYKTTDRLYLRNVDFDLMAVSAAEKENFRTVYDYNATNPFVFIPYPATSTDTWDGKADHYNWVNGFEFDTFTEDIELNGYNGIINLAQAGGIG